MNMNGNKTKGIFGVYESALNSVLAELFLDNVLYERRKTLLLDAIDKSLENKDEQLFLSLTDELNKLQVYQ